MSKDPKKAKPAEAVHDQDPSDTPVPIDTANETPTDEDLWAMALAEQAGQADPPIPNTKPHPAAADIFQPFAEGTVSSGTSLDRILDIPVELSVELGRTRMTLKEVLQLGQGSVVELDGLAGEPMDIYINSYLIAQGEVVVVDEQYGIRITDIITPSDRLARINQRR